MSLSRGLLLSLSFASTSVLGAAAGCVGDSPEVGSSTPTSPTPDASTSGGSSSSSSGSGSSDAAILPDAPAPIVGFCAVQVASTLKFCEDFEAAGASLGAWTSTPPAPAVGGSVTLTPEPDRGNVLFFDTVADAGAPTLFVGKTFDPPISFPYVIEYDMRVNEHAPATPGAPYNGFVGATLPLGDLLLFGVAEGTPVVGGGGVPVKGDAALGPERLNPYTPVSMSTDGEIKDIGFNTWFHVRVVVSATGDTQVALQNPQGGFTRASGQLGQLSALSLGFQRGAADRWTVFYDNVLVKTGAP